MSVEEATFACSRCGRSAARVLVVPAGEPLPPLMVGPQPAEPEASFFSDMLRIVVDAERVGGSIGGASPEDKAPAVVAALRSGDAAALFAADPEVARFWCPRCAASYCGTCWRVWDVFDPDYPGWFEEQRGECPQGHERTLID